MSIAELQYGQKDQAKRQRAIEELTCSYDCTYSDASLASDPILPE